VEAVAEQVIGGPADPLLRLMWRYCGRFTNSHDISICDEVMAPDYTLYMGSQVMRGRDEAYKPASGGEFERMPDLALSVRKIITDGERLAMYFVEHGSSPRHGGNLATWDCIALYRWNGTQLVSCYVEEDYYARRRQLKSGLANPVGEVAIAPFSTARLQPNQHAEAIVREWIEGNPLSESEGIACNDSRHAGWREPRFRELDEVEVRELFSCGNDVAFSVRLAGPLDGGLPELAGHEDERGAIVVNGIATTDGQRVQTAAMVSGRFELLRTVGAFGSTSSA
jgi:hypothetical protein